MNAHARSPVCTRRAYQAAYNKSPLTDTGGGVGANTSPLTVVAKSLRTHRSHFVSFHPSCPTCEQEEFGRKYVCLPDQGYSGKSFICVISRSSPAFTASAGSPSIHQLLGMLLSFTTWAALRTSLSTLLREQSETAATGRTTVAGAVVIGAAYATGGADATYSTTGSRCRVADELNHDRRRNDHVCRHQHKAQKRQGNNEG